MTSQKQLESNRANSQRSTGPKTPRGKARSSLNALKHGLTAAQIVIGDEDPQEFEALRANFERDFQAETDFERELVERIASYTWRLRRIPVFEAAYMRFFERQAHDADPFSDIDNDDDDGNGDRPTVAKMASWLGRNDDFHNALAKLSRYEAFLSNAFNRTLQQLLFLRSARPQRGKQLPSPNIVEGRASDDDTSS